MSIPRMSVNNPVAMNLLMLLIIGLGVWDVWHAERTFFPEVEPDRVSVLTLYPGANPEEVEKGITAKLSSIHVNYWVGSHTKVTASRALIEEMGLSDDGIVFCGDSPNDEPLFEHFPHSVGVANITRYLDQMDHPPRYTTQSTGGGGFQEVVNYLLNSQPVDNS